MTWLRTALLGVLAACSEAPQPVTTEAAHGLEVESVVDGGAKGLVLTVRVSAPADATWTAESPRAEGLTLADPTERVEQVGERMVTTRTFGLRGPPGSYTVEPVCASLDGADEPPVCAPPLYLEVGVKADRAAMADIVEPPATWPVVPIALALAAAAGAGLLALAFVRARKRAPAPVVSRVAAEPPDVAAIRAWEALRDDPTLSDFDKALGLSEVFRTYAEAVLSFPARAYTTTQTLAHLESLDALPKMNVPRARRLLRATDRVKYAEARPGESFFEDLEADLHAFIDQTRPRAFTEGGR